MSTEPVDFDKFLGEIDTAKVAMAKYDPTRDKLGRKIHPRSTLARRRNMFLGRFNYAAGMLDQLCRELVFEYREVPAFGANKAKWLPVHMANLREQVRLLRAECDEFYRQAHNIGNPPTSYPPESEK